jgi:hypothetical protein
MLSHSAAHLFLSRAFGRGREVSDSPSTLAERIEPNLRNEGLSVSCFISGTSSVRSQRTSTW